MGGILGTMAGRRETIREGWKGEGKETRMEGNGRAKREEAREREIVRAPERKAAQEAWWEIKLTNLYYKYE